MILNSYKNVLTLRILKKDISMLKFALLGCGRISNRHSDLLGLNQ